MRRSVLRAPGLQGREARRRRHRHPRLRAARVQRPYVRHEPLLRPIRRQPRDHARDVRVRVRLLTLPAAWVRVRRSRWRVARATTTRRCRAPTGRDASGLARRWRSRTACGCTGCTEHVVSAAGDDVEPAWDRSFHRDTRLLPRLPRRTHRSPRSTTSARSTAASAGIWNARQAFFVAGGMRYARCHPGDLQPRHGEAVGRARAHRAAPVPPPRVQFAGVLTTRTSRNRGTEAARRAQERSCARSRRVGTDAAQVPRDADEHPRRRSS